MLCTNCSTHVQPVVAVDIDGTLGDYHGHFVEFATAYTGVKNFPGPDPYLGVEPFREWCQRYFQIDERTYRDIKLAYRQGAQKRSMPAYPLTSIITLGIRQEGAELWLTTTRPYMRLDGIDPDTREWLRRNEVEYDGLIYDEDKYAVLADRVDPNRVVAVLDDLWEQYDAACSQFGAPVPILRRNSYNMAVHRPNVANELSDAYQMIRKRINRWREIHD